MSNVVTRYFDWLQRGNPAGTVARYPKVSATYESNVKGIYIVGDLSGIPLIKFAAQQGYEVAHEIYLELKDRPRTGGDSVYDAVIIGAGAAGIAAAAECKKHKLSYVALEGARIANTIANFPKGKIIFAEPIQLTNKSVLPVVESTKEQLLEVWHKIIRDEQLNIREGVTVADVRKRGEFLFEVRTEKGETIEGRRVVLAIGKAGKSRTLGVPGEKLPKVSSRLIDPSDFKGQEILVAGGGDSAVETAIALAEAGAGNRVQLSYRGKEFARIKEGNAAKLEPFRKEGLVEVILNSNITEIGEDFARLKTPEGERTIKNQYVFTMLGSEPPYAFLKKIGVSIQGAWTAARWTMFALSLAIFTVVYFGKRLYHADLLGQSPSFWYGLLYCTTVVIFGIRRIVLRRNAYITKQTVSLMAVQVLPLFLIPTYVLPWMNDHGWISQWARENIFLGDQWWRFIGFILAPPLLLSNVLTPQAYWFWIVVSVLQVFVVIPLLIRYYGKGAYCGWICSCGALAETLGDPWRTTAPHGPKPKRWENLGQAVLAFSIVVLILHGMANWMHLEALRPAAVLVREVYDWSIDVAFAGVVGVGAYFFYSGRVWCRFGCPLAALMHIYTKFTRYRIFADKKKCISCGICTNNCHMGIDVMNFANKGRPMDDVECVRCSACVVSCPMDVLSFGMTGKGNPHDPASRPLPIVASSAR